MKEPRLQVHPEYKLLTQSDVVAYFHMQMPRWLFFDPKYRQLSLETKVAYTFLLNRFQLSKMNSWINADNEVFIIFPREKLAEEMGVSYRKAIACFKELLAANLIWEHRLGRGNANRIYLAAVTLSEDSAASHNSAPFATPVDISGDGPQEPTDNAAVPRSAETACLTGGTAPIMSKACLGATQEEVPSPQDKNCKNGTSGYAESALPDMQVLHPSKKDFSKKDRSKIDGVSQSCHADARDAPTGFDRLTDKESERNPDDAALLCKILEGCELEVLPDEEAGVFRNAITRLYYSDSFRIGTAVLPGAVIRSHLCSLDGMILLDTREKLRRNLDKQVKNSTAYVMATLLNNIWESKSDLMVDPYLNSMGSR